MKFAIRAALAALSIGSIPPAFADESGPNPNTTFNELPGVIAEAPAPAHMQAALAARGYVVFSVSYRLAAKGKKK